MTSIALIEALHPLINDSLGLLVACISLRLLPDNNLAENEIRPITLGRKNYLFCGNHEAAQNMAVVCSLLATCRNHNVNPRDYLNDVIAQMPYHAKASHEELVALLPHKWKLKHPESLMTKTE